MNPQDIMQYSSFGIGVIGIIVAFIQGFERRKLQHFMYSQAWHIFSISNLSFGAAQATLKEYKETCEDKINPKIFEPLSKCEAYNITLFIESIRQIQLTEPAFNLNTIMTWQMQGRISKDQASYFIKAMPISSPSIINLAWNAITLKVRNKLVKSISPHQDKNDAHDNSKVI
jgi:hypothetical protein